MTHSIDIFRRDQGPSGGEVLSLPLESIIDQYLEFYAASSSHTARAKRNDLNLFLRFLSKSLKLKSDQILLSSWSYSSVQRFIEQILNDGEAPATVARRLATLKHFGRTLAERIPGFTNPAREVKSPAVQTTRPKALQAHEIDEVKSAARNRTHERSSFGRLRNLMIVELMLETGLRAEEVRLLRPQQFSENKEWFQNVRTKGRKFRNVYISTVLRDSLARYLEQRESELKRFFSNLSKHISDSLPLFPSSYRANADDHDSFLMSPKTLWRAVHEVYRERSLHPHLLRHSFALELLDSSKDIRLVSQALGHSDVRVTMRYTERRDAEVAEAIEKKVKE